MAAEKSGAVKDGRSLSSNRKVSSRRVNAPVPEEIMKARSRLLENKAIEDIYTVHGSFSAHDVNTEKGYSLDQGCDDLYLTIGGLHQQSKDLPNVDASVRKMRDADETAVQSRAGRSRNVTTAFEIGVAGSEEIFEHPDRCSDCSERDADVSVAYCTTCKKYFCKTCRDKHSSANSSKDHMMFDKNLTVFAGTLSEHADGAGVTTANKAPTFKEHRICFKNDKKCSIVAIKKMVFNGYIVADSYNNKILFLSNAFYVQGTIDLPGTPRDVCCLSAKEIAVTESKFVHIITNGSRSNRMIFGHECYGICHRYGLMYVADGQYSIHVYKINGEKANCINLSASGFDKPKTTEIVEMSNNGKELYVIGESQGLITLTLTGSIVSNYIYTEVSLDLAFSHGDDDSFFLSGKSSKNVILISGSDQERLEVIIEDLSGFPPSAICWDSKDRQLLVASKNSSILRAYSLA